ncbi:MAG TPA: hypothetical protein PKJ83_04730 [Cyclobacteriaceae bacterium]|nr:hypothetical protein [Cyclobacteriaceae bacterium]HPW63445.1 hypothetical protein [Cyclobacteriaceae bacterium]
MKTIKTGVLILMLGVLSTPLYVKAQDNFDDILKGSLKDANILAEGYAAPAMRSIGAGLNFGWYNTAKTHKTLGFDLTFTGTLVYIPSSDDLYKVDNNTLTEVKLISYDGQTISPTGSGNVPTIFGPAKSPTYQHVDTGETFLGPEGVDLEDAIKIAKALPVPMYQLGIGLPKNFDLKVRFTPTVTTQDLRFNLFGIGIMHDIKQYIPGIKALPFDLSVFAGYTKMKAELKIDASAGANQKGILEFNSTTIQALISKKISVLTFYGGLGYDFGSSNLDMKGTYDLDDDGVADATDPVALDFSTSGFRATGGLRLKLSVFTLHGDYTLSQYNALNVGFGINVR